MSDWDDDAKPVTLVGKVKNGWDDDDDDDVQDSWDAPAAKPQPAAEEPAKPKAGQGKKANKGVKGKIAQKEAAEKEQQAVEAVKKAHMTPEEREAEKLALEKRVREADAAVMIDAFAGATIESATPAAATTKLAEDVEITSCSLSELPNPNSDGDAVKFAQVFAERLTKAYDTNATSYSTMIKELIALCLEPMGADEVKDVSAKVSVVHNNKLKATKDKKKPKKKAGPSATMGKKDLFDDLGRGNYGAGDDYDEFM